MAVLIKLSEIVCYGYHGVLPEEQSLGQEFRVSLELALNRPAPAKDLLTETMDYREAVAVVLRIMEGPPRRLLETLASEIASAILQLEGVGSVKVIVCKPHPPMPAVRGGVAVELSRTGER